MQSQERFVALLNKYTSGTCTQAEYDELFSLIATGRYDHLLEGHFHDSFHNDHVPGANMPPEKAQELMQKILHTEKHTAHLLPGIFRKNRMVRWYMAAAATVLLAFTTWMVLVNRTNNAAPATTQQMASQLIQQSNNATQPQQIKLEDGSAITLQPGSTIRFPPHFSADKREVYLEGEAFFEVSKNPDRPFFVYYNNLVTHVLGTSFHIKTDIHTKQVEVSVVTGKVQVYEKRNTPGAGDSKKMNGVILTPNQKVIYKEEERQFTATIVNNPMPIVQANVTKNTLATSFDFEEARLTDLFKLLEKTYGIEIVVDNDRIYNCLFTGNISQHNLFTKLDIICESVKAGYQVVGTRILVNGKGCN
jgi:transmembrane sensor